jgi:tRNA A-37 threonylcarbamoyl transferase component Bud32
LTVEGALAYARRGLTGPHARPLSSDAVVQFHIDDCDRCRMLVAEAARCFGGGESGGTGPLRTLADGQQISDRYRIERFIARGGMGEVYEAFDCFLGCRVALKTLLPTALDDRRAIESVVAEVRLARQVTHPNVCRILEFGFCGPTGKTSAAIPFLTMELLQGEPLSRRIARAGRLPAATVALLAADIARGLAAFHDAGIVHRDLKSDNVFLVRDPDGGERAVVMDFGLARGLRPDEVKVSSMGPAGTPDYMAPEQVEGKAPTPGFDIYAFGVVMFEMLTGQKPFAAASPYLAAVSRLRQRAPAPSQRVAGLRREWDQIVGRCLQRRPERRFASAEQIASAVQAISNGDRPPVTKRTLVGLAGLAIGMFAAVGLGGSLVGTHPAPPAARAASSGGVTPPGSTNATAFAALGAPAAPVLPVHPGSPPRRRRQRPAVRPSGPLDQGRALLDQANSRMLEGDLARACELGELAARRMQSSADAERFLGQCYVRLGRGDVARRHYRRYLQLAPDAPDVVFIRGILDGAR